VKNRVQGLDRMRADEGALSCQHLDDDEAQRDRVGALVNSCAANLLRSEMANGSEQHARKCRHTWRIKIVVHQLGDAEVEDLGGSGLREQNVLGFQVTMDESGRVCGRQTAREFTGNTTHFSYRQRALFDLGAQRSAIEKLPHDERSLIVNANVEDTDDVFVIDLRGNARL
jgi:hypothetical protein